MYCYSEAFSNGVSIISEVGKLSGLESNLGLGPRSAIILEVRNGSSGKPRASMEVLFQIQTGCR